MPATWTLPPTLMAIAKLDEEKAKNVVRQARASLAFHVEFYFSDSNLPRDNFLQKSIQQSGDGRYRGFLHNVGELFHHVIVQCVDCKTDSWDRNVLQIRHPGALIFNLVQFSMAVAAWGRNMALMVWIGGQSACA
ncbi:hypothetical protein ACLOJK_040265 [Asimina triloba]